MNTAVWARALQLVLSGTRRRFAPPSMLTTTARADPGQVTITVHAAAAAAEHFSDTGGLECESASGGRPPTAPHVRLANELQQQQRVSHAPRSTCASPDNSNATRSSVAWLQQHVQACVTLPQRKLRMQGIAARLAAAGLSAPCRSLHSVAQYHYPSIPHVSLPPGSQLADLAGALAAAGDVPTVIDLGHQTLQGPLRDSALVITAAGGHTIQHGTLLFSDSRQLVINTPQAVTTTLTNLIISGPGPGVVSGSGETGLLHVASGRACLVACTVAAAAAPPPQHSCAALLVDGGAAAELDGCVVTGSAAGGLVVAGPGSKALARECELSHNAAGNVEVRGGGLAHLTGCELEGGSDGLLVQGEGSSAVVEDCEVHHARGHNVLVRSGGDADVARCELHGAEHGPGLVVRDAGSKARVSGCELHDNRWSNLRVQAGGSVELSECTLRSSRFGHGVLVRQRGSSARVSGCEVRGNELSDVAAMEGGAVELVAA